MQISLTHLLLLLSFTLYGCSANEDTLQRRVVYPVSGSVTAAGQPLPDASVVLHPVDQPNTDIPFFLPRAITDKDGRFTITTYERGDGAPPGTYWVAFSWQGTLEGLSEDEQDALPERLPPQWTKPGRSGITVVVADRNNELAPFELR
jgi:hypothetical protein